LIRDLSLAVSLLKHVLEVGHVRYFTLDVGKKLLRRIAPIICVAILAVGAAACGSSGGSGGNQKSPTPTSTPAKSGGAGF
jgi:hypothetical protein